MKKLYKILILLFICHLPYLSYGAFGDSCSLLPSSLSDEEVQYLKNETIYGYIINFLDPKHSSIPSDKGCKNANLRELYICVRDNTDCTVKSFPEDSTTKFREITDISSIEHYDSIKDIDLTTRIISGKLCLSMDTVYGFIPLVCKVVASQEDDDNNTTDQCQHLSSSCYTSSSPVNSRAVLSFSGRTVQCVVESLYDIFFISNTCPQGNTEIISVNPFYSFVASLKKFVFALLIVYTIIFGAKLALHQDFSVGKGLMFVLKILFVIYFTVGFNTSKQGNVQFKNGTTELVLPLLLSASWSFSNMMMSATSNKNGLCVFDINDYDSRYKYYAFFDAIDCRIGHYLGLSYGSNDKFNIFEYIWAFLVFGYFIHFIMCILFVLSLISMSIKFLSTYVMCIVNLYVMCYVSVIFVPFVLFEQTKQYFTSWLHITVSYALQPMVVITFIVFVLMLFDKGMYGTCTFSKEPQSTRYREVDSFKVQVPTSSSKDDDDDNYNNCVKSPGYVFATLASTETFYGLITKTTVPDVTVYERGGEYFYKLLYMYIILLIFYTFFDQVNIFAAEVTGGQSVNAFDLKKEDKKKKKKKKSPSGGGQDGSQDTSNTGDKKKSGDSASTGSDSGASGDSVSTGSGSGASGDSVSTGSSGAAGKLNR